MSQRHYLILNVGLALMPVDARLMQHLFCNNEYAPRVAKRNSTLELTTNTVRDMDTTTIKLPQWGQQQITAENTSQRNFPRGPSLVPVNVRLSFVANATLDESYSKRSPFSYTWAKLSTGKDDYKAV